MDQTRRTKGFTLIELLVVISIIAFLTGILMSILGLARKQAKHVICQSNLRQWGLILHSYTADHDNRLLPPTALREMLTEEPYERWSHHSPPWYDVLRPYYEDSPGILLCPTAQKPTHEETIVAHGNTFRAWRSESGELWSYAVNTGVLDKALTRKWTTGLDPRIPAFSDSMHRIVVAGNDPPEQDGIIGWAARKTMPVCFNRHRAGINILFSDWSVRKIGLKEPWTLKWAARFDTAGPWTLAGGVKPEDWPQWMRGFKDY